MATEIEATPKERADSVLSVRFTSAEMEQLKSEAQLARMPVSAFVRRFALARHSPKLSGTQPMNLATQPQAVVGINASGYVGTYSSSIGRNT